MRRMTIVALGALALSACTGAHIKAPAVCDGKHRRPANLYGSVLPTLPIPLPASQPGGQSMVIPGPAPGPGPLPPPPAEAPATIPSAGSPPTRTPSPEASAPPAPRTSQRDVAPAYLSC